MYVDMSLRLLPLFPDGYNFRPPIPFDDRASNRTAIWFHERYPPQTLHYGAEKDVLCRFERIEKGILRYVTWDSNIIVAGGSVVTSVCMPRDYVETVYALTRKFGWDLGQEVLSHLYGTTLPPFFFSKVVTEKYRCFGSQRIVKVHFYDIDIDIFFCGSAHQMIGLMKQVIFGAKQKGDSRPKIAAPRYSIEYGSRVVFTIIFEVLKLKVQFIWTMPKDGWPGDIAQLLNQSFDHSASCVFYRDGHFYSYSRGLEALRSSVSHISYDCYAPDDQVDCTTLRRVMRYCEKGICTELTKCQYDYAVSMLVDLATRSEERDHRLHIASILYSLCDHSENFVIVKRKRSDHIEDVEPFSKVDLAEFVAVKADGAGGIPFGDDLPCACSYCTIAAETQPDNSDSSPD